MSTSRAGASSSSCWGSTGGVPDSKTPFYLLGGVAARQLQIRLPLDCLEGQIQRDVVADKKGVLAHVEGRAPEREGRIGAAGLHPELGILHALKMRHGKRHRPGHPLDREIARQARLLAGQTHLAGLEGDDRIVGGIEEICRFHLRIQQSLAGVDRSGVNAYLGRSCLAVAIEYHYAADFIE